MASVVRVFDGIRSIIMSRGKEEEDGTHESRKRNTHES